MEMKKGLSTTLFKKLEEEEKQRIALEKRWPSS